MCGPLSVTRIKLNGIMMLKICCKHKFYAFRNANSSQAVLNGRKRRKEIFFFLKNCKEGRGTLDK